MAQICQETSWNAICMTQLTFILLTVAFI